MGMRRCWIAGTAALLAVGCARSHAPPPATSSLQRANIPPVHPANIKRVVRDLPPGYEVTTAIADGASPRVIWSLGADASDSKAKPPQCGTLADPGKGLDQSAQGVSGSGGGGIVDAVVVDLPG